MKRSATLALIGSTLGIALAIGVPGIGAEQQAQALAPCNNSLTCQPANVPMLVEAGMIKIGADGIVKTATVIPKSPAGATGGAFDWLGGIVGAASIGVAGWFASTFFGIDGADMKMEGSMMTTDGLPETQIDTEAGTQFDNAPAGPNGGCYSPGVPYDGKWINAKYSELPGSTCGQVLTKMYNTSTGLNVSAWSVSPFNPATGAASATITYNQIGNYVTTPKVHYGYRDINVAENMPGSLRWYAGDSITAGTKTYPWVRAIGSGGIVAIVVVLGDFYATIWSAKGPAQTGKTDTQSGTMERTLECTDPAGVVQTLTNNTVVMLGNGALSLAPLKCPPGTLPLRTGTTWKPETGVPIEIIPKPVVIPKPITEMQKYPDCWDGKCVVTLEKADGTSCGRTGEQCPDWSRDPKRSQNYVCKFGGYLVNLNMCSMYRAPEYGVLPNTGTDGEYLDPSAPVPGNIGKLPTLPNGTPAPTAPVQEPMKNCRPESFLQLLNPFWVFQAVQCAITETFVPRQEKVAAYNARIQMRFDATSIGQAARVAGTLMTFPTIGSGCTGPPLRINMPTWGINETYYPFNACAEPMAGVAAALKNIGGFLVTAGGALAILRYGARIINYNGLGQHDGSHGGTSSVRFK